VTATSAPRRQCAEDHKGTFDKAAMSRSPRGQRAGLGTIPPAVGGEPLHGRALSRPRSHSLREEIASRRATVPHSAHTREGCSLCPTIPSHPARCRCRVDTALARAKLEATHPCDGAIGPATTPSARQPTRRTRMLDRSRCIRRSRSARRSRSNCRRQPDRSVPRRLKASQSRCLWSAWSS
jgi:hypothetical protein